MLTMPVHAALRDYLGDGFRTSHGVRQTTGVSFAIKVTDTDKRPRNRSCSFGRNLVRLWQGGAGPTAS